MTYFVYFEGENTAAGVKGTLKTKEEFRNVRNQKEERGMIMSKELIRLQDLVMEFDGERILDGINLYFNDHEFLTLLGPSGCGKTTTLRIIGGFLNPTSGTVLFDGKVVNDVPPYERQVNTVFQRYALFPHLDVFGNVAFGLMVAGVPMEEIQERVHEMLKVVGLQGFEHRSIDNAGNCDIFILSYSDGF